MRDDLTICLLGALLLFPSLLDGQADTPVEQEALGTLVDGFIASCGEARELQKIIIREK